MRISIDEKNDGVYEFFVALILLLSDLCLDRNFLAINPLSDKYKYELCFAVISSKQFDVTLRYAFTRLITTLYIDREMIPIVLPNRVRLWNELDNMAIKSEN